MRVDQLSMHGFDKGAADRIGRALRGIVERGFATGNSIAIGRGGTRVYEEYCGYADLARTAPVDESTKFRVYSMTKVVTAVAVMQLWEQGVFSLNDPVSAYIPSFAAPNVGQRRADGSWELRPAAREIMVRDLLTMTSGIPYTGDDPAGRGMDELVRRWRAEQEAGRPWDTVRVAEEVGTLPLMFDPGSYYNYGFSFDILGALIQIWTGLTLAQYCERHIFRPLGMRDSGFLLDGAGPVAEMCTFGPDGQLIHADEVGTPSVDAVNWGPPHFFSGGAGMISTLGDYFKFTRALALGGTADGVRLIGSRTLKLMSAPHLNARQLPGYNQGDPCAFGPSYNYGFGVRVMTEPIHGSSISSVGEWGWSGALGTWMAVDPKEDLYFVYMHQHAPADHDAYMPKLLAAIYASLA